MHGIKAHACNRSYECFFMTPRILLIKSSMVSMMTTRNSPTPFKPMTRQFPLTSSMRNCLTLRPNFWYGRFPCLGLLLPFLPHVLPGIRMTLHHTVHHDPLVFLVIRTREHLPHGHHDQSLPCMDPLLDAILGIVNFVALRDTQQSVVPIFSIYLGFHNRHWSSLHQPTCPICARCISSSGFTSNCQMAPWLRCLSSCDHTSFKSLPVGNLIYEIRYFPTLKKAKLNLPY